MDVFEVMRSRRSIREYKRREVEREKFMIENHFKRFYILNVGRL